ncbi:MAG: phytanoyl-CoA dioxygenase family protein [Candidatus Poribacteria bacterium]|jgi:ectoine hydroxylase-related dioxygenase (phytanoyl-CoA dioxygenase family)|nr:phytanoyl-CoA dioxygenase family protein [Candidatus Poribacteria bacterium]MDP7280577.1 phytanoyl-CoA dioxygenase family protein [Candidatus Poribacteria bacterium]
MMTAEEKFIFDLQGYIVIKNVLTTEEVAEINEISHRIFPRDYSDEDNVKKTGGLRRTGNVSKWDPACQRLIDHPNVTSYLNELLGPTFRLDHDYCIFMCRSEEQKGVLHGGPETTSRCQFYRYYDGIIRNGLSALIFFFADAGPEDGGFVCVPGSHKSNFLSDLPTDVRELKRLESYIVQPVAKAGDALLFTEALVHGTRLWQAEHERRTFLYKYSPGHISYSQNYYNADDYFNPTDQQRRILSPPSADGRLISLDYPEGA